MCGIMGFTHPGISAASIIGDMVRVLNYRGPDQSGQYVDTHIALGHCRLTIISPQGGEQPRVDANSGDALVFNGEIYGYRSHLATLRGIGAPLRDDCDTEVLFTMLRQYGVMETLERIDGMFAFAFREGATGKVHLARDRFGEKPLFYSLREEALHFASELKSLTLHPRLSDLSLDPVAANQFLSFEYMPGDITPYAQVRKVLPGHVVTYHQGKIEAHRYWTPVFSSTVAPESRPQLTEKDHLDRLDVQLNKTICDRLVADVPVGVFLSGGIDSSLVAAVASKHMPGITAFTIKMQGSYDESPFAIRLARQYGLRHVLQELTPTMALSALDEVEEKLDEPLADSSIVPTYLLCKLAKQHVKVSLGGDGADELFAGYPNFQAAKLSRLFSFVPEFMAQGIQNLAERIPTSSRYMSLGFKLAQLTQGVGLPTWKQPFAWMAPFTERDKIRLYSPEMSAAIAGHDAFSKVEQRTGRGNSHDFLEQVLEMFTLFYLPDDILTKVDRTSMYNSLEVRAPFLGREFAEHVLSLPVSMKIKGLTTKYLLKKLALRYLPRNLVYRPKHGFPMPVSAFMRGTLRQRISDTILDRNNPIASWFKRQEIERLLNEHLRGERDHRKKLWALYCLFGFVHRSQTRHAQDRTE